MDKKELRFQHESLQDLEAVSTYLKALVAGFDQGQLQLRNESREVTLKPHGLLHFDLEASEKGDRVRLNLRLTWKKQSLKRETTGPLTITPGAA